MLTLSCFADEISPELSDQLSAMEECGIKYLSLRSVWDTNVLKLSGAQVAEIRKAISDRGIGISSIGSPVGKTQITDDTGLYLDQCKIALERAEQFSCKYVRLFSFYIPQGEAAKWRGEVIDRTQKMLELARAQGTTLLHENEGGIYGESSDACLDLLSTINDPLYRAVFDPANFVIAGEMPFTQGYPKLAPYISYLHIKDAKHNKGGIVAAGLGDGQIPQLIKEIGDADMFATLEPHLAQPGQFRGFSGREKFIEAYSAFKTVLEGCA